MSPNAQGALWMTGTITSFSAMAVAGRAVQVELNTFEIMFYRSLIGFCIVLTVAGATGHLKQVTRRRLGEHMLRNMGHFAGQNLWFFALTAVPLAQVFALEFTTPLWVTLLAPFLLAERLTPVRALSALIGFAGILIVARPDPAALSPGTLAAALAAVGFATSVIMTKRLTRTETTTCILFWLTLMQAGFGLVFVAWDGQIPLPSAQAWPGLAVIAATGLLAHFCLTRALQVAPASLVMPIDFLRLPVIAIVGMLLYAEPLDVYVFVGGALIFLANFVNIRAGNR